MTKDEIKEGNKLIAEFMELGGFDDGRYGWMWHNPTKKNGSCFSLEYDSSWDWLMPVYKKLMDKLNEKSEKIKSNKGSTWVSKQEPLKHIDDCLSSIRREMWGARIGDTFYGIIETIKFLNENRWS
jgi:hypothetical protein